jgi:hypothetical protein
LAKFQPELGQEDVEETGKKEDSQMDTVNQSYKRKEGRKDGAQMERWKGGNDACMLHGSKAVRTVRWIIIGYIELMGTEMQRQMDGWIDRLDILHAYGWVIGI